MLDTDNQDNSRPERHHKRPDRLRHTIMVVRNTLNLLFTIAAIAGMVIWYQGNAETGKVIIYAAIAIKFAESAIRLLKL